MMPQADNTHALPANLPQLRFPEFKDAGAWNITELKDVACFVSDKVSLNSVSLANYVSTENLLPDYEGIVIASKLPTTGSVTQYAVNDILISNIRPYLKKVWFANQGGGASNDVIVVRAKDDVLATYLSFILRNDAFIDYVMKGAKGVKMPRGDIALMKAYSIAYPQKQEQQKIAACLSSLDDLITTENQQLEALKTHKKGLMQSLFPAEGETVPKHRFPEFKDAGAWEERALGDICKFVRGPFGGALTKDIFVKNGYAVYEQSHAIYNNFDSFRYFITKEKYEELKRFAVKPNDIIMSCSGTMGRFAVIPVTPKEGVINQALLKLTVSESYDLGFIRLSFDLPENQEKMLSQSAGGAIKNVVGVSELKKINMFIPSLPEQQKIAACLSSLDDLISAQSQKIEALKQHKKGLMQQLFPAVDGGA